MPDLVGSILKLSWSWKRRVTEDCNENESIVDPFHPFSRYWAALADKYYSKKNGGFGPLLGLVTLGSGSEKKVYTCEVEVLQ